MQPVKVVTIHLRASICESEHVAAITWQARRNCNSDHTLCYWISSCPNDRVWPKPKVGPVSGSHLLYRNK